MNRLRLLRRLWLYWRNEPRMVPGVGDPLAVAEWRQYRTRNLFRWGIGVLVYGDNYV